MSNITPITKDELVDQLRANLPVPIREENSLDGSHLFVGGDPGEVVVRMARSRITVASYSVHWEGPHSPVVRSQTLVALDWKNLPPGRLVMLLRLAVEAAQQSRRATYRKCVRCGVEKPPEWMHDSETCQGCAVQHLGIVY